MLKLGEKLNSPLENSKKGGTIEISIINVLLNFKISEEI